MAHRRKSSHPLCKQQRINSVVDRVLAAKLQQNEVDDDDSSEHIQGHVASDERIAIPTDLFNDFQALKSATHLDTTELMRTLIKDYAQLTSPKSTTNTTQPTRSESTLSNHSNHSSHSDKDTDKLSEYYRQGEPSRLNNNLSSPVNLGSTSISEPLDLSVIKTETPDNEVISLCVPPNQVLLDNLAMPLKNQYSYNPGYGIRSEPHIQTSMRIPTVVQDVITTSNAVDRENLQPVTVHSKIITGSLFQPDEKDIKKEMSTKNSEHDEENTHYKEIQFQNGALQIKGTKSNPQIQLQDLNAVNIQGPLIDQNFLGALQSMGGVFVPYAKMPTTPIGTAMQTNEVVPSVGELDNQNLKEVCNENAESSPQMIDETIKAQLQAQQLMQQQMAEKRTNKMRETWNQMHGKRARMTNSEKEAIKNDAKSKKGQMKLIAENTSNGGVYTSVLKLPWSRRSRNPKPDTVQASQPPAATTTDNQQTSQQSPIVLLPVTATAAPNSQGVFIPTSSWPVPSDSTTVTTSTQPLMMVYPNASFENFGKPVRKRGRPPKVPLIARLLADSAKKKKVENIPLASFIPGIPTLQQPAIVLNVNNQMVGTENTATAVNSATGNGQSSQSDQTVDNIHNQIMPTAESPTGKFVPVIENQPQLQNIAPMPTAFSQHPLILPKDPNITAGSFDCKNDTTYTKPIKIEPKCELTVTTSQPMELKTMTTTTVANTASGALYQEMILSSKSLVSVKSRRRQTTTELLKSKSQSENFICTSFRLRPVKSGREKKTTTFTPGMRRRGRPPKRRLISSMFENAEIQMNQGEIIHTNMVNEQGQPSVQFMDNFAQNEDISPNLKVSQFKQEPEEEGEVRTSDHIKPFVGSVYEGFGTFRNANHFEKSEISEALSGRSFSIDNVDNLSISDMSDPEDSSMHMRKGMNETNSSVRDEDSAMFQQLFHCRVCNEIIPVDKKDEHSAKHRKIKYGCNGCGSSYHSYINQESMESLQCEKCDTNIQNGSTNFTTSSTKILICTDCSQTFEHFEDLNSHMISIHQKTDIFTSQSFKCSFCAALFSNKKLLKNHLLLHKDKIFHCPVENCGKSCITKERMKLHIKIKHHDINYVQCIYEGCNKKFLNSSHLQEHVRFKHMTIKAYKCSWPGCETEFPTERHLKVHLLMHTDEKPLKCDFCDYRCRQGNALNWHVRKHHPEAWHQYSNMSGSGSSENSMQGEDIEEVDGC